MLDAPLLAVVVITGTWVFTTGILETFDSLTIAFATSGLFSFQSS